MKFILFIIIFIGMSPISIFAQSGFLVDYNNGDLVRIDLENPTNEILIGNLMPYLGDIEFATDNLLYGLPLEGNAFIQIDTTSAEYTQIGTSIYQAGHYWTGLAYDIITDTLFASSTNGTSESAFYTVDVTTGEVTLIGICSTIYSVVDIAFDADGQMYAYNIENDIYFIYLIDKTNGTATYFGNTGYQATGLWHGMDYCFQNNTMYLSTYNAMNYDEILLTVDLNTGYTTNVGTLYHRTGGFAITNPETSFPVITVNPAVISFDSTSVGTSSDVELTIYNTGNADLEVSEIIVSANIFSVDISSFTVAPADSQIVLVTFTPSAPIIYSDSLIILSNDPEMEALTVQLSGNGYTPVGIEYGNILPDKLELINNYPNPFNPSTNISFTLADPDYVKLEVYNIKGEKVKTLVNKFLDAKHHIITWNGTNNIGRSVSSGVYFYKLKTPSYSSTKRMILLK